MPDSYMNGHIYYSPRAGNVAENDYEDVSQAVSVKNQSQGISSFVVSQEILKENLEVHICTFFVRTFDGKINKEPQTEVCSTLLRTFVAFSADGASVQILFHVSICS